MTMLFHARTFGTCDTCDWLVTLRRRDVNGGTPWLIILPCFSQYVRQSNIKQLVCYKHGRLEGGTELIQPADRAVSVQGTLFCCGGCRKALWAQIRAELSI
jgi:hypothetical protein